MWPFNTGGCLIEVTTWTGLTVYQINHVSAKAPTTSRFHYGSKVLAFVPRHQQHCTMIPSGTNREWTNWTFITCRWVIQNQLGIWFYISIYNFWFRRLFQLQNLPSRWQQLMNNLPKKYRLWLVLFDVKTMNLNLNGNSNSSFINT